MKKTSEIKVYDDLLTYAQRETLYSVARHAQYKICGPDNGTIEHQKDYSIVCLLNREQIRRLGILELPEFEHLKHKDYSGAINISTPTDSDRIHTDGVFGSGHINDAKAGQTLLYFINLNWDLEWQGFTIFTSDDKKSIIKTVEYVPGRFVLFDGAIPHKVCSPSSLAPTFRLTLAIRFDKD
jgi:hypothetical protein